MTITSILYSLQIIFQTGAVRDALAYGFNEVCTIASSMYIQKPFGEKSCPQITQIFLQLMQGQNGFRVKPGTTDYVNMHF